MYGLVPATDGGAARTGPTNMLPDNVRCPIVTLCRTERERVVSYVDKVPNQQEERSPKDYSSVS